MSITNSQPVRGQVVRTAIDARLSRTGVATPGTVVSYDAASATCTVRLGVHRLVPSANDADLDDVEEHPALQDVPVCWPVGRGFQVLGTLSPGDSVLLVCMDRDISGWRRTGQPAEPEDARVHSWSSAVAVPGLVPAQSPFPAPGDAAALASKVDEFLSALATCTPGPQEPGLAALKTQFAAYANPLATSGSTVLKLES